MALGVTHHSGHAGDDDGGAAVPFWCGLEEGETGDGGEVDGGDVRVVGGRPVFVRLGVPEFLLQVAGGTGVGNALWAGDAGGSDEEGEIILLG